MLSEWELIPLTSKDAKDDKIKATQYVKVHGLLAEYILRKGIMSVDVSDPTHSIIKIEEMCMTKLASCTHCGAFGSHEAFDGDSPTCEANGHCQYCGEDTLHATYAKHEAECKEKGTRKKCFRCKTTLSSDNHSPVDTILCSRAMAARTKAESRRRGVQMSHNTKLLKAVRAEMKLGVEDFEKLLRLRAGIHANKDTMAKYAAMYTNNMDT